MIHETMVRDIDICITFDNGRIWHIVPFAHSAEKKKSVKVRRIRQIIGWEIIGFGVRLMFPKCKWQANAEAKE